MLRLYISAQYWDEEAGRSRRKSIMEVDLSAYGDDLNDIDTLLLSQGIQAIYPAAKIRMIIGETSATAN